MEHAMSLYRAWADAYGLSADSLLPPSPLSLPPSLPPAPHLEDCAALTALRQQAEQRGEGGEPPAWADPQPAQEEKRGAQEGGAQGDGGAACCRRGASGEASGEFKASATVGAAAGGSASPSLPACCSCVPQPPWFPPSCANRRLLVVPWPEDQWHGMGSQVHIMAVLLSVALSSNRILVPLPASYGRANSTHCHAMGHGSSWSCFFAPIASPLCSQQVALALSANQLPPCVAPVEGYRAAAASVERVVCVNTSALDGLKFEASAAGLWGEAYAKDPDVVEQRGEVQLEGTEHKKLHWWRAQAVRFMLRWPSAHLCHVINQQRHTAYGMHVANRMARQAELHSQLLQSLPPLPPPNSSDAPSAAAAAEATTMAAAVAAAAAARFAGEHSSTHSTAAAAAAAAAVAAAAGGGGASGSSLSCEPYMVRPIVSIHVRQSDKQVEMGVWSFAAHMLFAARLQRTHVDLKHVWLSTEMQSVINEAATPLYAGWTFLYAPNGRLPEGALDPHAYDALQSPAASLASLLIAAQCDAFIGSLGSNWSRLINELRATSGRLYSGFVAMNLGEW
ncbi:unnamed protein product [Closterium sp. Yama58-4]|nr:unnamed protein product [Closterium sp. Yama58-4]